MGNRRGGRRAMFLDILVLITRESHVAMIGGDKTSRVRMSHRCTRGSTGQVAGSRPCVEISTITFNVQADLEERGKLNI